MSQYSNPWIPSAALNVLRDARGSLLDIGGGISPFVGATHIVDLLPFDAERLSSNAWGGDGRPVTGWRREQYSQLDLGHNLRWPFDDQSIELGLCSHTIEDLPDPIPALNEIARICRTVLIICPSRLLEHTLHLVRPSYCGFRHHTWMVEASANELRLTRKSAIQLKPGCHVTCPIGKTLPREAGSMYYFGPPLPVRIQTFATPADEAQENRAFMACYRQRPDLFVDSGDTLSFREWTWLVRARWLGQVPGIGRRYQLPKSTVIEDAALIAEGRRALMTDRYMSNT